MSSVKWLCCEVAALALTSAVLCELVSWIFVYRTAEYQRLKASIDKVSKRIEKKKETAVNEKAQKKIGRIEKSLGPAEKNLAFIKARTFSHALPRFHRTTFELLCHRCGCRW